MLHLVVAILCVNEADAVPGCFYLELSLFHPVLPHSGQEASVLVKLGRTLQCVQVTSASN